MLLALSNRVSVYPPNANSCFVKLKNPIHETHATRFAPRLRIRMAFYILEIKLKNLLFRLPMSMFLPRIIWLLLLLPALSITGQILSVLSGGICNYLCHGSLAAAIIVTTVTTFW